MWQPKIRPRITVLPLAVILALLITLAPVPLTPAPAWTPASMPAPALSALSAEGSGFAQRALVVVDAFAHHEIAHAPGTTEYAKYAPLYAQARFALNHDIETALQYVETTARQPAAGSMFVRWSLMDTYLRSGHLFSDDLRQVVRQRVAQPHYPTWITQGTENHRLMEAVAGYLAAQTWGADWADAPAVMAATREFLVAVTDRYSRHGLIEYDSPTYQGLYLGTMHTLAEFAEDPEIAARAKLMLEWLLMDVGNEWLDGYHVASSLRNLRTFVEPSAATMGTTIGWLYFGGRAPQLPHSPRVANQESMYAVQHAIGAFRLPEIIERSVAERAYPYLVRETHDGDGRFNPGGPGYRKQTYLTPDFGISSQYDGQGSLAWSSQMTRWMARWPSERDGATFLVTHPHPDAPDNYAGRTRYEQVLHHESTVLAVYDIPTDDPAGFIAAPFTSAFSTIIEPESGWVVGHAGEVMIGLRPLRPYQWRDRSASGLAVRELYSPHRRNGAITEVVAAGQYRAEADVGLDPAARERAELDRFAADLATRARVDELRLDADRPGFTYTTLSGTVLDITFGGARSVAGVAVNFQDWPLVSSPYVQQAQGETLRVVSHPSMAEDRVYNYHSWTVGAELPSPVVVPVIVHEPVREVSAAGAQIEAAVSPANDVEVTLHYRYGDPATSSWQSVVMLADGGLFRGQLPVTTDSRLSYFIEATTSHGQRATWPFADDFSDPGYTERHWSNVPTQWSVTSAGTNAPHLSTAAFNARTFLTGTPGSALADTNLELRARYAADGLVEFFTRARPHESGGYDYYAAEVDTRTAPPTAKLHWWQNTAFQGFLAPNAVADIDHAAWHDVRIENRGDTIELYVNGARVHGATDAARRYPTGFVGLRSFGASKLAVADVIVSQHARVVGQDSLRIEHKAATEVAYNSPVEVQADVVGSGDSTELTVAWTDGVADEYRQSVAVRRSDGTFHATIAGTNRSSQIRYHLVATDGGSAARYPQDGDVTVTVRPFTRYQTDFSEVAEGAMPAGWSAGGGTRVETVAGRKVLRLPSGAGQPQDHATFTHPDYQHIDNFIVRFRARHKVTSEQSYNLWRMRYRTQDPQNNYAIEWGTHNRQYYNMRWSDLGGYYIIGSHHDDRSDDWVEYELRVAGDRHEWWIDGVRKIVSVDSDAAALGSGYLQFMTVFGIDLQIDDLIIEPLPAPLTVRLLPAGNVTGLYAADEPDPVGLAVTVAAGDTAREVTVDYRITEAQGGDQELARGSRTYRPPAWGSEQDTIPFTQAQGRIGTYDVAVTVTVDGAIDPDLSTSMRMAVVPTFPEAPAPDLDMRSKFGLNSHYQLNWHDDLRDGMRKLGARHHRTGIHWPEIDRNQTDAAGRPIYDFSKLDAYEQSLSATGMNHIPILSTLRNEHYDAGSGDGTLTDTAGLRALQNFQAALVTRYRDRIRHWETANEPELFTDPYHPYEVVQQWKRMYRGLRAADPDAVLIAGDHTSGVRSYLPRELELGAYDYADAFSWHPYVYNAMPEGAIEGFVEDIGTMIDAYGGWKDFYLTEGGWPTAAGGPPNIPQRAQRDFVTRAFLTYLTLDKVKVWELYNFRNTGTDPDYYEINWGITDHSGRPKLAFGAVANLASRLDEARYLGPLDTEHPDVSAHVFLADSEPVIAVWKHVDLPAYLRGEQPTTQLALRVGNIPVTISDIEGKSRSVQTKGAMLKLTASGAPQYVYGADTRIVADAVGRLLVERIADADAKLAALGGVSAQLRGRLFDTRRRLCAAAHTGSANEIEASIAEVYSMLAATAELIAAGAAPEPGFVAAEALFDLATSAGNALEAILARQGVSGTSITHLGAVASAQSAFDAAVGEHDIAPVSQAAMLRLRRQARLAQAYAAEGEAARAYVSDLHAKHFAGAVPAVFRAERIRSGGVWLNITPIQLSSTPGSTVALTGAVVNDTGSPQQATVRLQPPSGWGDGEQFTVQLAAGAAVPISMDLRLPADATESNYQPEVAIEVNGEVVDKATVDLAVDSLVRAQLMPVNAPVGELQKVTVTVTGQSEQPVSGRVMLRDPAGTLLHAPLGDRFTQLAAGATTEIAFNWTFDETRPFHRYETQILIEDDSGSVLFSDTAAPLDFRLIQRADGIVIDGRLDDWRQAYPINLRGAQRTGSGRFSAAELSATAYAQWDDSTFYLLIDVTDELHAQREGPGNLWRGDSVQLGLDPLNTKRSSYQPDDVEWGWARSDAGAQMSFIFISSGGNPSGDVSDSHPFVVVRDDQTGRTYYEVAIPTHMVAGLTPREGAQIGYNIAVNDAGVSGGRDDYIQWTKGVVESKNPSLWDSFTFVNSPVGTFQESINGKGMQ